MTAPDNATDILKIASDHMRYDRETGHFFNRKTGQKIGYDNGLGYRQISLPGNKKAYAHRLAWLFEHGKWPDNDIDHLNHDRSDDRISNLRDIPHRENMHRQINPQFGRKGEPRSRTLKGARDE